MIVANSTPLGYSVCQALAPVRTPGSYWCCGFGRGIVAPGTCWPRVCFGFRSLRTLRVLGTRNRGRAMSARYSESGQFEPPGLCEIAKCLVI